ncbi:MAG: universal stress protein [Rhodospirillaceae bacterium]|jgi:nucleotide-binding universal stress UspA family protein|nr:universal stress protein [Rhodospirillaceae bacterium]
MTIRSVLALVDGGSSSEQALKAAIRVGLTFDAHVEILHVEPPLNPFVPALPDGVGAAGAAQMADDLEADIRKRAEIARGLFQTHCIDAGLKTIEPDDERIAIASFAWRLVSGHDNPELARRGRLVDLIVMGRPDAADGGVDSAALEAALFDTGRPVLIAGNDELTVPEAPIAIAWDGSREATRGLSAALPFLKIAKRALILSVSDAPKDDGLENLAIYLRGHGIDSEIQLIANQERTIAETLHQELQSHGVGLTVMGAYGHSVISEFLFGGVTRDMLKDQQLTLFLAH